MHSNWETYETNKQHKLNNCRTGHLGVSSLLPGWCLSHYESDGIAFFLLSSLLSLLCRMSCTFPSGANLKF